MQCSGINSLCGQKRKVLTRWAFHSVVQYHIRRNYNKSVKIIAAENRDTEGRTCFHTCRGEGVNAGGHLGRSNFPCISPLYCCTSTLLLRGTTPGWLLSLILLLNERLCRESLPYCCTQRSYGPGRCKRQSRLSNRAN